MNNPHLVVENKQSRRVCDFGFISWDKFWNDQSVLDNMFMIYWKGEVQVSIWQPMKCQKPPQRVIFLCCFFLVPEYIHGFVAMSVSRIKSFLLSRHINKSNILWFY